MDTNSPIQHSALTEIETLVRSGPGDLLEMIGVEEASLGLFAAGIDIYRGGAGDPENVDLDTGLGIVLRRECKKGLRLHASQGVRVTWTHGAQEPVIEPLGRDHVAVTQVLAAMIDQYALIKTDGVRRSGFDVPVGAVPARREGVH